MMSSLVPPPPDNVSDEAAGVDVKATASYPLWPLAIVVAASVGFLVRGRAVFASDPKIYLSRIEKILDGNLPYLESVYEHFPLALAPMGIARFLPGGTTSVMYALWFGILMTTIVVLTGFLMVKLTGLGGIDDGIRRWLLVSLPLVPLVAYRVDPLPTALALLAFLCLVENRATKSLLAAIAGVAAKGWPIILAPFYWRTGRRWQGVVLGVVGIGLPMMLLTTDGFQQGREFDGVHLETPTGSMLAFLRSIAGTGRGAFTAAGAAYVDAPAVVLLVGPALAVGLLVLARKAWAQSTDVASCARLVGVLLMAIFLGSPLLSAQFLFWMTPWIVFFGASARWTFASMGVATFGLLAVWAPNAVAWQSLLLARNGMLLATAAFMVVDLRRVAGGNADQSLRRSSLD